MLHYSQQQYRIFRIIFGLYLFSHFLSLYPYSRELFADGIIPDPLLNPTSKLMPFFLDDYIEWVMGGLVIASLLFTFGIKRRSMALILWLGWAYLLNRNNLISNPGVPYVGWLLLVNIAIEPNSDVHPRIFWVSWFFMGLGYTISGLHKLQCPSWLDGSALFHVLSSVLAKDNFITEFLLSKPTLLKYSTWATLWIEILTLPLGTFDIPRKIYWIGLMIMHLGILLTINFVDLTLGVLMIHLFTFDARWLKEFPFRQIKKLIYKV